jgi:hypothetical protein
VREVSGLYPVLPKWEAFGWHCQEIDGHDLRAILTAIERAQAETERPSCIVARTVKGKGVPFMEADNSWHKRVPTKDELEKALAVLANRLLKKAHRCVGSPRGAAAHLRAKNASGPGWAAAASGPPQASELGPHVAC